tara:strand:- start:76 stop:507 length:432 start_codon:yes stop_codon:yes gene_type:complete
MRVNGNDSIDGGRNNARSNATAKAISGGHGTTFTGGNGVSKGESTPDGVWFQPVVDNEIMDCPGGVCPVPWTTKEVDNVNHPPHYTEGGIECIEAIEAQLTPEEYKGYLKGNVAKYIWREKHKGGIESLKKAQWYLTKLIVLD